MKRLLAVIGLVSFAALSCTNDAFDTSLNGSWIVYSFENLTTGKTELKTQENSFNKDITIQFDDTTNPMKISGTNITNQISGKFSYMGPNQFKVSELTSTNVYQPRWADEFIVAMLDPDLTFQIINDRLLIYYDSESKRVTLKRE